MTYAHRSRIEPPHPIEAGLDAFRVEPTELGMCITCAIGRSPAFSRLVIRYRTDGAAPETPRDGLPLLDVPVAPGVSYRGCHHPLYRGFDYIYALFGLDEGGAIKARATIEGSPLTE